MESPFRIFLADDHVMFRRGVRSMIQGMKGVEVVGEASDGLELLRLLQEVNPDLVIMDISMPNLRGLEATREIKLINPEVKVLILTMHKDREYLYHALTAGAEGYLLKEDADGELISAIQTLRKGGTFISPLLSTQMADIFVDKFRPGGEPLTAPEEPLTVREREIIKLIAEGKSSKEIGELLFISSRTVQHHRANIMRKLDIKKTADLVKYAIQKGYVMAMAH
ncbi:MAG: response regulator transcription factor [Syntrophobacterales bacterium]|jgi:DNA-binding NarL/FixJ family response regulator|nr:response regulator transcription factor [Syntrophobacterales bacterium]